MKKREIDLPPSLNSTFLDEDISMNLTESGLLVNRAEQISRLYAEFLEWDKTKENWHKKRLGDRGSRHSSQKIFRILKARFQSSGPELPSVEQLPPIFNLCENHRDKAQILYFYLLGNDALFQYTVHTYVRRMFSEKNTELNFDSDLMGKILKKFRFRNGGSLEYSKSTLRRWKSGFRSVMREIGVLESSQAVIGGPPAIGEVPLIISAGYSWKKKGKNWFESPIGWIYLFQPLEKWKDLANRLEKSDLWTVREVMGKIRLVLEDNPFNLKEGEMLK